MNSVMEKTSPTLFDHHPSSLGRRLGAMTYDFILLVCIVFFAWQPVPLLPEDLHPLLGRGIRLGYLIAICFGFFGWFWCHGGQTLGMRAWRIKLVPLTFPEQTEVSWSMSWLRFISALLSWGMLGMGFIWALFQRDNLGWHDIISGSKLIIVDKK